MAIALLVASVAALLGAVVFAGRFRGPVVPPMPWIDLVLPVPLDRALALRRWWRYAAVGGLFVGALSGLTVGAGLAFAHLAGVVTIVVTTVIGTALGVLATRLWLWSQVRSWPGPDRGLSLLWRVPDALRELHAESLRAHSANTSTMAGSALTGNLRTARLALTRPVRHGRSARLRPGRPFGVLVRRDVLGLRRTPGAFLSGLGLTVLGGAIVTWAFTQPAAPSIAATIGLLPLYLGFGAWAEGLRLQADNVGTPSLLGTGEVTEAVAHVTVPTALTVVVLGGWVGRRGGARLAAGQRAAVAVARPRARRRGQRAGGVPRLPDLRAAAPDGGGLVCRAGPDRRRARLDRRGADQGRELHVALGRELARLRRARLGGLEGPSPHLPAPGLSDNPVAARRRPLVRFGP